MMIMALQFPLDVTDVVSDVASWNIHSEISRIQIFKI